MQNIKKGSRKYKGKFHFKCFHCGRIGNFSSKSPYTNTNKNKEDYEHKRNKNQYESNKGKGKNYYKQKINLYAQDDGSSSDEDENDSQEVLFLAMSSKDEPSEDEKGYLEDIDNIAKVDFEREFMCAQEKIKRLRKKNHLLKKQLKEIKGSPKVGEEEEITNLKREIEQDRIMEDRLIGQIKEMEDENKYLREELDRAHEQLAIKEKFENRFVTLDRFGLGYNSGEKVINEDVTSEDFKEKGKS